MAAPLTLRPDFIASDLRRHARQSRDASQARRLLALAVIYDGGSRGDTARTGGIGLQIIRDWVVRFNVHGLEGLVDRKAPGPTPKLAQAQWQALVAMVEKGPMPAVHGVVRWRLTDLAQWVWEEWRIGMGLSEFRVRAGNMEPKEAPECPDAKHCIFLTNCWTSSWLGLTPKPPLMPMACWTV